MPAHPESTPSATHPKRIKRLTIGVNVIVQIVLMLIIVVVVNIIGFNYYHRWDLFLSSQYTLSEKTKQVLSALREPLDVVMIRPQQGFPLDQELVTLLDEYKYFGRPHVNVEILDTYKDFARVSELQTSHNFSEQESIVIVEYAGRSKLIDGMDLFNIDASMAMFGQQPQITEFLGESKVTGAILEVLEDRQPKIFYTQGHLEPLLEEQPPLGYFYVYLERDNYDTEPLELATIDQVPEEASMVAILAPQFDFSDREIELMNAYWKQGGRLYVMLDPTADTPKLNAFLAEHGVTPRGDRVLRPMAVDDSTSLVFDAIPAVFQGNSPITDKLVGAAGVFARGTQSLGLATSADKPDWLIKSLIVAPPGLWGEVNHAKIEEDGLNFDQGEDFEEPLALAASVQKAGVNDPRVAIGGPRMVVVGNGTFLNETDLAEPNLIFAVSAVNWLTDREAFIGIPPREMNNFVLRIEPEQFWSIFYIVIVAIPFGALTLGVLVWWVRRN